MNPDLIITSLLAVVALVLVIGGPILIFRRASRLNAAQEAEARAFEQEILVASKGSATGGTPAASPPASNARPPISEAMPVYGAAPPAPGPAPESGPPEPAPSAAPPVPESSPAPSGPPSDGLSPFVRGVIEKLEVAQTFKAVEGPLRCGNPELKGTLISLKGNRRYGIVEAGFDREDPAVQALLRHVEGLIVAGADGEALVFKRFQDFLSDLIAL